MFLRALAALVVVCLAAGAGGARADTVLNRVSSAEPNKIGRAHV